MYFSHYSPADTAILSNCHLKKLVSQTVYCLFVIPRHFRKSVHWNGGKDFNMRPTLRTRNSPTLLLFFFVHLISALCVCPL